MGYIVTFWPLPHNRLFAREIKGMDLTPQLAFRSMKILCSRIVCVAASRNCGRAKKAIQISV